LEGEERGCTYGRVSRWSRSLKSVAGVGSRSWSIESVGEVSGCSWSMELVTGVGHCSRSLKSVAESKDLTECECNCCKAWLERCESMIGKLNEEHDWNRGEGLHIRFSAAISCMVTEAGC
jgi:hypothetical protein